MNAPGLFEIKTRMLEEVLARVDRIAGVYDKSTSREATALAAITEMGKIYRQLGQSEKSARQFEKALAIAKERVKIKNYSDPSRYNLALCYRELALSTEEAGRDMKKVLEWNEESLKVFQEIDRNPKDDGFKMDKVIVHADLAEAYMRVGITRYRLGDGRRP